MHRSAKCDRILVGRYAPAARKWARNVVVKAATEITALLGLFFLLSYRHEVLGTWQRVVVAHGVSGKQTHDAHIVAMMQVHGVRQLLTFNGADFKRFDAVEIIDPAALATA